MVWDFAEAVPLRRLSGRFDGAIEWVSSRFADVWPAIYARQARSQLADACESPLPDDAAHVWFTDPPYYDAVRTRTFRTSFSSGSNERCPTSRSCAIRSTRQSADSKDTRDCSGRNQSSFEGKPKDREFFEERMARAFAEGRRVTQR